MALMAMAHNEPEPSIGLTKLAREALDECGGNRAQALIVLRTWLTEDTTLYQRLIDPMIDDACDAALRQADSRLRQSLQQSTRALTRPQPNPDRGLAGLDVMADRTLYDLPLPGGKRLGEATPADIFAAIDFYKAQARGHLVQMRRYELIRDALGEGTSVERAVPLTLLNRLWMQAEEE